MAKLKNDIEYEAIYQRIEELLPMTDDDTPWTDRRLIELDILSELAADYEEEHAEEFGLPVKQKSLI